MQIRFHDLDLETDRGQKPRRKFERTGHARLERGIGGNTGMADEFLELFNRVKHARHREGFPAGALAETTGKKGAPDVYL